MKLTSDTRPDQKALEKNPEKKPPVAKKVGAKNVDLTGLTTGKRPDQESMQAARAELRERPKGLIPIWSFSTLKQFETCRYAAYLSKVKKMPRVDSPAAERGSLVHDQAEMYIRGEGDELKWPKALDKMAYDYLHLRRAFENDPESFQLEDNWGFDAKWNPCTWKDYDILWCRQKLDVFQLQSESSCFILDHKTGKKFGNEMKHADQGFNYAVGAMMKYPTLQFAQVEFWYTDHGQKLQRGYTREQVMGLLPRLEERAFRMTTATEEELTTPAPTINNCRFCDHAKTGSCEFATRPPDPEYR